MISIMITLYLELFLFQLWKNGQVKIKPNISFIKENILENSKLVYFAADEQTKIDWPQIPCNIVDVASKPYFEVSYVTIYVFQRYLNTEIKLIIKMASNFLILG